MASRPRPDAEQLIRAALAEDAERYDVQRLLLAHGACFTPVERPADVAPGRRHDFFGNAYRLASARPELRYCEGFTLPHGWTDRPNRHAWCADEAGNAIDPSPGWTEPGRPLRPCYFGIALPLDLAAPYARDGERPGKGVLYEMTGRVNDLAAALGLEAV
jgi:hypothetical protein